MDRQAIIERVAQEAFDGKYMLDILHAFHKVGLFELLEAAEEVLSETSGWLPWTKHSMFNQETGRALEKLDEAIRKVKEAY